MISLMLLIGLVFGFLAGAMAFLITYEEYRHHRFGRRELLRRSTHAALATMIFFLAVAIVLGLVLPSLG